MKRYLVFGLFVAGAAFGQDGFRASYDATRSVTLKGVVIKIDWVNPHAYLYLNVQDANWAVEIGNPLDLERDGWKRTSVHIGDRRYRGRLSVAG